MSVKDVKKLVDEDKGVLDYLVEMRELSELIVDLAYSSVLLDDKELAQDVVELERRIDRLRAEVQLKTILSRLPPEEAEGMVAVLQMADYTEKISNYARNMTDIVLKGVKKHPLLKEALTAGDAGIHKVEVKKGCPLLAKKAEESNIVEATGMKLLAVKKKNEWHYMPHQEFIEEGDILLVTGSKEEKKTLEKLLK
jgi:uncharacterized protein with PhoU and TrkA domain